ncbi:MULTISPECIES: NrfD/PsrC family molybdoenzyme membrane anchor subunit [Halolamina]|uniref:Prokaryotic molybdopterin-containing oxidoreductase family, membrane subunit n=1 Tax=Halolamina pelagica TaxID=699431 RepID=A0A1I5NJH1_9EURY|nr:MULTISPECIES: NrfD/PsrC family molybdoenzyme membrane anchor subunit [Halolamina]NHX36323.1 polysulfide reductase NrfD [Halolamina sp. R1-12]SFP21361.1 prokaryotic molybdopterin-containing oxidoreductase family, membrane subunit [Halolamina pelagica]
MSTQSSRFEFDPGFEDDRLRVAWYAVVGVLVAVGAYATYLRITGGMATTNLTSIVPWGAWVAFYIYFVGLSAGAFLVSTMANVFEVEGMHRIDRDALFAAIISMAVALLFVWIDLGRMDRMYFPFIWRQLTSALSWEVHAYVAYIGILVTELYFSMRIDLARIAERTSGLRQTFYTALALGRLDTSEGSRSFDQRWLKRAGIVGIPLAIFMVHGGTGVLFAVSKARPYWNSGLFPVIFVISALLSGTALVMVVYVLRTRLFDGDSVDPDLLDRLAQLLIGFIIVDAALTAIETFIAIASVHPHEIETWQVIMYGPMSWSFWWFMVGFSWVFPMVLLTKKAWRRTPSVMVLAGLSVVIGIIAVRFNIVVPAQIMPVMEGLPHGAYFPTLVEWGTSIGMIGVGLLLYTLGAETLPLTPLTGGDH